MVSPPRPAVTLRLAREDDVRFLADLRRDTALQALLLTVPAARDDDAVRSWIERRGREPGGLFRIVEDASCGGAIGYAQIGTVHRLNRTGYGGICLAAAARGRGLGREALRELAAAGREDLGLQKLLAEIRIDNPASLRAHLAVGYRVVGTLSRHFTDADGQAHDVLLVERLLGEA